MGAIHFSVDLHLVAALRKALPLDVFVETGTFNGDTTALVASLFPEVLTVELSTEQYKIASHRLRDYPNVRSIHGSSPVVLKELRCELNERSTLYWLDAHWCGGVTAGSSYECPLIDELSAIDTLNDKSVVLIDDARFFLSPPPPPHEPTGWPTLEEVIKALKSLNNKHKLWIINDVLIFYPKEADTHVVEYGRSKGIDLHEVNKIARNNSTILNEIDHLKNQLRAAQSPQYTATSGLNSSITDRSETIFFKHLERMQISSVLDVGSNSGQFSIKLRRLGYKGTIYSVEPQSIAHEELLKISRDDPRWIPLPRQAAGAHQHSIEINVSENSWSSSILDVHENHLRAAPSTRRIRTEEIFVTRTGELLAEEILKQIQAVKIDVQGYEAQVLSGYLDFIPTVRLLMLELSMVKCYDGAPDMFELDQLLVNTHGFSRVSFEPSFYDDATGIAQQFDGIYYRPQAPHILTPSLQKIEPIVATSTAPQLRRPRADGVDIGSEWEDFCVHSWFNITDTVISVTENQPRNSSVKWLPVSHRPSILQILEKAVSFNKSHVLLINADIGLLDSFKQLMISLDPNVTYYGHRVEVISNPSNPTDLIALSIYEHGFDYFLLPVSFVNTMIRDNLIPAEFLIGEPWWDYLIPLAAESKGFPVKRLPSMPFMCVHYKHEDRYSKEKWIENGSKFLKFAKRLFSINDSHNKVLLKDILESSEDSEENLERVSDLMRKSLP